MSEAASIRMTAEAFLAWHLDQDARHELADGRLTAPRGFVPDGSAYHLISPVPFARDSRREALLQWLRAELARPAAHRGRQRP